MFKLEQNNLIVERSGSTRALYLVGGSILSVSGAALLMFTRYVWLTGQQSKSALLGGSLLFVFVIVLGITAISQSGAYKLTMSGATGEYKEETS